MFLCLGKQAMQKLYYLSIIILLLLHLATAKEAFNTDSLLTVLKISPEDSSKLKSLKELSHYLLYNQPEKSIQLSREMLAIAQRLGIEKYMVAAYEDIGGYYYYRGDFSQAKDCFQKTLAIGEKLNSPSIMSSAYSNLSLVSVKQLDYGTSLELSEKAMSIAEKMKDTSQKGKILLNRALIYMNIDDYATALNYLLKSLSISEIQSPDHIAICCLDVASIYMLQNNYDKAFEYLQRALNDASKFNDRIQQANALDKIGEIYRYKKDWGKALDYFQQAINIGRDISNFEIIISSTQNIALVYNEQGKYEKAIETTSDALALSNQVGDKLFIANSYELLGEIYMKMKNSRAAIIPLKQSLAIARAAKFKSQEAEILLDLSKCYESLNDYKTQAGYLTAYNTVKDSIISSETVRNVAETEAKYHLDKKEKEIALLKKDKEIQAIALKKQTTLKNSFIICMALLCVLFFFIYRNYRARQLLKMETLRSKIASDLHDDIGSTLSSISIFSQMARHESKEIVPMLEQIGEYSRKMLESMADIVWTINPENDNFEKIILRMRSFAFEMLGAKNIDFDFNAEESLNTLKLKMEVRKNLFLIFKEATNNLVKYAEADQASFSITSSKNILTVLIRDNGKGFDLNKQLFGNGLKNMKNRALEIGAQFLIESEPGKGTTIQLLINTA